MGDKVETMSTVTASWRGSYIFMYKAVVRQLFEGAGNSRLSTRAIKQRQTPNILKDDNVKFDFVASEYQTLVVKASEMLTEA